MAFSFFISSKFFCGHAECSFHNPVENVLPQSRGGTDQWPYKMNQLPKFSKKGLFWNFTVTYKTVLTTPLEKKDERLKFVCSKSANEKILLENFFHWMPSWTGIMHTWQLRRKIFHQRLTFFRSFTEKNRKFSKFTIISLCMKRIQWTRRMQFRQFQRKKSTNFREVFAHWPKLMEKPNLFNNISLNFSD